MREHVGQINIFRRAYAILYRWLPYGSWEHSKIKKTVILNNRPHIFCIASFISCIITIKSIDKRKFEVAYVLFGALNWWGKRVKKFEFK